MVAKKKTIKESVAKDVSFTFRINSSIREQFTDACAAQDLKASYVLRRFMSQFVIDHEKRIKGEK